MRQWLTRHGIPFNPNDLKRNLLCLIKASNIRTKYKTDVIAENFGHEVVRLPVAHCELNPIEMAWATVKNYIRLIINFYYERGTVISWTRVL